MTASSIMNKCVSTLSDKSINQGRHLSESSGSSGLSCSGLLGLLGFIRVAVLSCLILVLVGATEGTLGSIGCRSMQHTENSTNRLVGACWGRSQRIDTPRRQSIIDHDMGILGILGIACLQKGRRQRPKARLSTSKHVQAQIHDPGPAAPLAPSKTKPRSSRS
ncbi:hypothetical protein EDB81DRAFT_471498 [Dactylonectria macrodidyma]|uniref:Uncharacterized protein n=1 Tax=Dactylonectria macrodidyma TaxID=307937 RepID=A0A9P9J5A5_9HYPO|nr:hypothetical protein EDB81DRAFT_471498 [Dactylonectria macrodidyma]